MEVLSKIDGKKVDTIDSIVLSRKVCPNNDVNSVEKVIIPSSIKTIKKYAFSNLVGVKEVEMPESLNDGSVNFSRSPGIIINGKADPGKDTNYTVYVPKNTGWNEFDGNKYYLLPETSKYATGWQVIDGRQYYFYSNGQMATAFIDLNGTKYYLSPQDGTLKLGWQKINGKWYYFYYGDGKMAANAWIDGYYVNYDGAWQ